MKALRRPGWRRCESGATAVELALVMPMFVALVFGIFNYGWAIYCGNEVRYAVQRASRLLIVEPDTSLEDLRAAVAERLNGAEIEDVDLAMTTETFGASTHVARITWTYAYTIQTPFLDDAVLNFDSSLLAPLRE
ncbi:MAG: pilus assembly protein [Caulobacter sp.]|nr:pilus assembly protein [Caulobacter sp.]